MSQKSVFSPFSELKETELEDSPRWVVLRTAMTHADHRVGLYLLQVDPSMSSWLQAGLGSIHVLLTPGPITTSQTYLRTLVLQRWDAEIRRCDDACKAQLSEHIQGPATHQMFVQELIVGRWSIEKQRCQEARKVQLLELLLAAHGVTTLV
ncbi:hypothetical protein DFJ58DRAFT_836992 [Suillus subalutaceus]|uniref:uncharacterized protein n=1 Tax=Suillus subalutaceus TaxID=48586 RepID=UPI001B871C94|nr:uncharacterized protein DFJ58DRAFT_836992 [Suillus subalutaceus]KAG1872444.1 hypothetical protein DFJ58DRAFT_836992 [Suillus subalutaceus]